MLAQEDLKNIGTEMGKVIEQNVSPVLDSLQNQINKVEKNIEHVQNQMVTKDYLDEKLAEHHGNIVILTRKGDAKIFALS